MARLEIAPGESLYYEYKAAPGRGMTFVFVIALTGSTAMWQGAIAPTLGEAGHLIPVELPEQFTRDLIAFAEEL